MSQAQPNELKVGVISCSGEELAEGTVSRQATRLVLEALRPGRTVTLCLPLFLAGGESERAFARVRPTVSVDGCDRRCAARATAAYSAPPAAEVVVTEVAARRPGLDLGCRRRLGPGGRELARIVAEEVATRVDELLGLASASADSRASGQPAEPTARGDAVAVGCECQAGGVPTGTLRIDGQAVPIVALPSILKLVRAASGPGVDDAWRKRELLRQVRIYNYVPAENAGAYATALWQAYLADAYAPEVSGR